MRKLTKRLGLLLLVFAAVMAVNVKKAEAAKVSAMAKVSNSDEEWESYNGRLKYVPKSGDQIPQTGECIIKLPTSHHYLFETTDKTTGEKLTYRVIGGAHYYVKDGFIESIGENDASRALPVYEIDADYNSKNVGTKYALICSTIPRVAKNASFDGVEFPYGVGTPYDKVRNEVDGEIVYIRNIPNWETGFADDGKYYNNGLPFTGLLSEDGLIYKEGSLYTGPALNTDGMMYSVDAGVIGSLYSGKPAEYVDIKAGKVVATTDIYKDGAAVKATATKITKLKAVKKGFTVKWNKIANGNGYQIQYALKKTFAGAKTVKISSAATVSKKITKLKAKKKYFVRVRSIKVVDGTTLYSAWSAVRNVKTKK